jgi:hypothetical protein
MVKRIVDKYGRRLVIDKGVAANNSQGVALLRESSVDVNTLTIEDEGTLFHLNAASGQIAGGGKGLYVYTNAAFKKLGGGELVPIICVNGFPLLPGTQIKGSKVIPITSAGDVALGAPILPAGYSGQEISIINVGNFNIEFTDRAALTNSNVKLHQDTVTLKALTGGVYGGGLHLVYSTLLGYWVQISKPIGVVQTGSSITPTVATLVATGRVGSYIILDMIAPSAASLTLTGTIIQQVGRITPRVATALTLTGVAGVSRLVFTITPVVAAALTLTGVLASLLSRGGLVQTSTGSLTLVALTPRTDYSIQPVVGSIVITNKQVAVTQGPIIKPSVATAIVIAGVAPGTFIISTIRPAVATIVITSTTPAVNKVNLITPSVGTLVTTPAAPTFISALTTSITPTVAGLTLTGTTSATGRGLVPSVATAIVMTGVTVAIGKSTNTGAVTLTGTAPTVTH